MQKPMEYHIAQINIGRILGPMDSPVMEEFAKNLEPINQLAESSPGFVWRLKDDTNNATSIHVFDDDFLLINMSVWTDIDSLYQFVFKTAHTEFLKRRKEWFERMEQAYAALWYVPAGHAPTPFEAIDRLEYLRTHGETPYAFGFKNRFSAQDSQDYMAESKKSR